MFYDYVWIQNVIFPILGMGLAGLFGYWIIKTINKVIDRRSGGAIPKAELEDLRHMIEDLRAEVQQDVAELQERVDFAERALTSGARHP
jgi:hypothetical protein